MKLFLSFLFFFISQAVFAEDVPFLMGINDLSQKREVLSLKMTEVQKDIETDSDGAEAAVLLGQKLDLLKQIDLNIGQQAILEKQKETVVKTISEHQKNQGAIAAGGISEESPYTFFFLDKVRDDLNQINLEYAQNNDWQTNLRKQIEVALKNHDDKEKKRRKIKEENVSKMDRDLTLIENLRLEVAELESLLAGEWINLKKQELDNAKLNQKEINSRKIFAEIKVKLVEPKTIFSAEDLKERLSRIEKLESTFATEMELARKNLVDHDDKLTGKLSGSLSESQAVIHALERNVLEKRYELASAKLRRSPIIREIWTRRYAVFNKQFSRALLRDWKRESTDYLSQLDRDYYAITDELTDSRKRLVVKDKYVGDEESNVAEKSVLERLVGVFEENLASLETSRKMHRKLLAEISAELRETNFKSLITDGWDLCVGFLNIEVISIEDRPITIGKIILALVLLVLAFSVSRRLSSLAGRKVLKHFNLETGPRQAIETLVYYSFLVIMVLFALYVANVPLTLFTVVGGALAIGVGFGSQNIINNFISSLIMMVEQPIRIGDIIEVEGHSGKVIKIGARCTHLRTFSNVDILVPNSSFLEKNVVNWTLTDDCLRTSIELGVSYESDTEKVSNLLQDIVSAHDLVLKNPEPSVFLVNFGESTLDFRVEFWVRLIGQDRREVESEIRHAIVARFRSQGIAMAFPQRDIAIKNPVEVSLKK